MTETAAADLLRDSGLPQAWSGQNTWRILDTDFELGFNFLSVWRAWQKDPQRPQLLHYVSLTANPPQLDEILASAESTPELSSLVTELAPQWFGLLPGFHRLTLNGGRVLLTLCVGELTAQLRQQQFVADSIFLNHSTRQGGAVSPWTIWDVKALARCCRRGTLWSTTSTSADLQTNLTQCGFEVQNDPPNDPNVSLHGQFNPRWTIKNTRDAVAFPAFKVGTCAVIGSGLAGASVAAALAKRGWQVQVLDQGDEPAAGASGLPVGLVVPHVSVDDCPLSRRGVRLMLHEVRSLLVEGQDWGATGVLERRVDGSPGLPENWPGAGREWSQSVPLKTADTAWNHGIAAEQPAIWHTQAAWLKPAQLIKAWLAQPGVTFQGGAKVANIRPIGDEWELLDAQGQVLCSASRVVIANAVGAVPLLENLQSTLPTLDIRTSQFPAMHGLRGLLSWAMHEGRPDAAFPPFPVNGSGSVVSALPVEGGTAWFIGSSYEPESKPALPDETNHKANFARLSKLLPSLSQVLEKRFTAGPINAWKQTRCVTFDRLPIVGPMYKSDNPGLWICAGMGSRGMTFSVLCAELLAARWGAEPLPVELGLTQSITAMRGKGSASVNFDENEP